MVALYAEDATLLPTLSDEVRVCVCLCVCVCVCVCVNLTFCTSVDVIIQVARQNAFR